MRDYVVRSKRTGRIKSIAEMSTLGVHRCLDQALATRKPPTLNPGVTVEAFIERLKLELFIREAGLRD